MTREKQTALAVNERAEEMKKQGYTEHYCEAYKDGYYDGALWADQTPNWHKCEEEMPKPGEEVLCLTYPPVLYVGRWWPHDETGEAVWVENLNGDIVDIPTEYWTKLPKTPKQ